MANQRVYVVSDIHLGVRPETEGRFRNFLAYVGDQNADLVINGDLFDFWFEYGSVIHAQHFRVVAALADLREGGARIRFVGGNHDAWGGRFLREEVGMEILPDIAEVNLAGWHCLLAHGDGRGSGDIGYRILKKVIRSRLSVSAFRILHPDLGKRIANIVSTTEGKEGNAGGVNQGRADALVRWSRRQLEGNPEIDLVLAGHTHTPTVIEHFPGRFYVNTGDWINHFSYLCLQAGEPPVLETWG